MLEPVVHLSLVDEEVAAPFKPCPCDIDYTNYFCQEKCLHLVQRLRQIITYIRCFIHIQPIKQVRFSDFSSFQLYIKLVLCDGVVTMLSSSL